jgi:hypothetical protein
MFTLKTNGLHYHSLLVLLVFALWLNTACKYHKHVLSAADSIAVSDSVKQLTANISHDLASRGPVVWLNYFQNSPQFFMAADGQLSFRDYHSAEAFIRDTLIKNMHKIELKWSNMRVDVLTRSIAAIGGDFHEDITLANGQTLPFDGYFSGTAVATSGGWKLRNAHWSMKKPAH